MSAMTGKRRWPCRRGLGRRGNVLILAALAAVPLIGLTALAGDFGRVTMVKTKLDMAADSAALLAATAASNAWKAGDANAIQEGIAAGEARFQAQSANQSDVTIGSLNVTLTQTGGLFNVNVSYTAQTPTTFAQVLGIASLSMTGQSSASLSLNPLVDIQVLMDASSSMALAATPAAVAQMNIISTTYKAKGSVPGNIGQNCSFACHWTSAGTDYYALAVKANVELRITDLQAAVSNLIQTIIGLDSNANFQLGLYTFSQTFKTIYPLGNNIAGAAASVASIVPDINFCSSNCPDTYFTAAMQQLTTLDQGLPMSGALMPTRFMFLVTDGVYDEMVGSTRKINAFSPADCAALKALGFTILVLYTPYEPVPTNAYWVANVEPVTPNIVPNLQACASSPTYVFVATDAASINAQLQAMLQIVVQTTGHLTN